MRGLFEGRSSTAAVFGFPKFDQSGKDLAVAVGFIVRDIRWGATAIRDSGLGRSELQRGVGDIEQSAEEKEKQKAYEDSAWHEGNSKLIRSTLSVSSRIVAEKRGLKKVCIYRSFTKRL